MRTKFREGMKLLFPCMVAVLTVQGFVRSHGDWAGALGGFIAGMLLWGICKLAMSVYHAISRRMAARK